MDFESIINFAQEEYDKRQEFNKAILDLVRITSKDSLLTINTTGARVLYNFQLEIKYVQAKSKYMK